MKLGYFYRNFIKNNLFIKLLLVFAFITVLTIATLSYILYANMKDSIIRSELANQRQAMENVNRYMTGKYDAVKALMSDVYRDNALSANIYYLLKHPFKDYIEYRLDRFSSVDSQEVGINGLRFFQDKLESDRDIRNLIVYSADRQHMYVYDRQAPFRLINVNAANSYVPDVMSMDSGSVGNVNQWVGKAIGQPDPKLFSIRTPINDQQTFKNIGQLMVIFDANGIQHAMSSYEKDIRGYILVLTTDGQVIFDSSNRYYGQTYPYANQISSLDDTADLEEESFVLTLTQSGTGYSVISVAPKSELAEAYRGLKQTILLIGTLCIFTAILIPTLFVVNYAKRTHNIIRFMHKVKSGEMTARIQDSRDDELGQISRSFNEMLDELVRYIDSVYKAEIKQKHTELAALQARVNPHFLYNTLEVIRMRAVSQGARDVSDMIYSLSVLFQNLVRVKKVYTLKDELEACRLYLELFRIRYKDKFSYDIQVEEQLANTPIMRLSLQPIVENYIVHGLDASRYDNEIKIKVHTQDNEIIRVEIKDNGRGIPQDRLTAVQLSLSVPETEGDNHSFGMSSIQERLKLVYGPQRSGIELSSSSGNGTTVWIWFPIDGKGLEDYDV